MVLPKPKEGLVRPRKQYLSVDTGSQQELDF